MIAIEGVLVNPRHIVLARVLTHVSDTVVEVKLADSGVLYSHFPDPNDADDLIAEIEAEVDMSNGFDWMGS